MQYVMRPDCHRLALSVHLFQISIPEGVASTIARYSASALDLATTFCFLLFHDIKLPPIKTQYPEVERLSEGEPTQFALCNQ